MIPPRGTHGEVSTGGRRRSAFTRGDRGALACGVVLTFCLLTWFSWRLAQTVVGDRAVGAGRPAVQAHGH